MSFRRFNLLVLSLVILVVGAVAGTGYATDIYGVYRSTRGRSLVPYQYERLFKYLFAFDYIPKNFDGLLVGSSATGNWDTSGLSALRLYNASMSGGNATEEGLIVKKVIEHGCPAVVLFSIQPYMTETSGRKSAYMREPDRWAGLGSLQLFKAYYTKWQIEHGRSRQEFSPYGGDDYDPAVFNRVLRMRGETTADFVIDEHALADYGEMVAAARTCGAKVVGLIPPVEQDFWERRPAAYAKYFATMRAFFRSNEPIVDLNEPALAAFRADNGNFTDGVHLSRTGAQQMIAYLDRRLRELGLARPVVAR